jgi:hypothetical protein
MIKNITLLFCLSFWAATSSATFVNLNFEDYSGSGPDLLPGWNVTGVLFPEVDLLPLGTAGVSLISTAVVSIEGDYSVLITSAFGDDGGISQTGTVPLNSTHISFITSNLSPDTVTYSFTLGGINLLTGLTEDLGNGLTRYTTPIGSIAGQSATLGFILNFPEQAVMNALLDDIRFEVIPIPATVWLFGSGLIGLIGVARRKRS